VDRLSRHIVVFGYDFPTVLLSELLRADEKVVRMQVHDFIKVVDSLECLCWVAEVAEKSAMHFSDVAQYLGVEVVEPFYNAGGR
jgi:hypothetical protein